MSCQPFTLNGSTAFLLIEDGQPLPPDPKRLPCSGPNLGYCDWHADADRRTLRGERQVWCTICGIWAWPSHVVKSHDETLTLREWGAMLRRVQREERARREAVNDLTAGLAEHLRGDLR